MKMLLKSALLAVFALMLNTAAVGAEKVGADDAVALVKKAVSFLRANGKEKMLAEVNNPNGTLRDRELYIAINDGNGLTLAHGANARLVGKNVLDMKDTNGKFFIRSFIEIANAKGKGWVDYTWPNPVTKNMEAKSTYVEKVDDLYISCGFYK